MVVDLFDLLLNFSRSNLKPPMGKGNKRDGRKRAYNDDDELDPMDPSSYSDAPRGGWYVNFFYFVIATIPTIISTYIFSKRSTHFCHHHLLFPFPAGVILSPFSFFRVVC